MDQVESMLKRPKLYDNIDGTGELGLGVMLMGFALLIWLQLHSPVGAIWHSVYVVLIWAPLMGAIIHYGTKAIKKHITYPRTGFVAYRKQGRIWVMIVAGVVAALASAGLALAFRSHRDIEMAVLCVGFLFAASYAFGFAREVQWKWAVVLAQVAGVLAIPFVPGALTASLAGGGMKPPLISASEIGEFLLCFILFSTMLLLSGAIGFWLYLRNTHAPEKETDEPANQSAL
jgi:hypothetical protein